MSDRRERWNAELERLHEKYGHLKPRTVVQEAAPATSPLHDYFEWNDETAAVEHRVEQARKLIRSFKVSIIAPERKPTECRQYVVVKTQKEGTVYRDIRTVISDDDLMTQLIDTQISKLEGAARQLRTYEALHRQAESVEIIARELRDLRAQRSGAK